MTAHDEIHVRLDDMITRTRESLNAMYTKGIGHTEAVSALVGSFLAVSERVEDRATAATHYAVLLTRAVTDQDTIARLQAQVEMYQAAERIRDELETM